MSDSKLIEIIHCNGKTIFIEEVWCCATESTYYAPYEKTFWIFRKAIWWAHGDTLKECEEKVRKYCHGKLPEPDINSIKIKHLF